MAKVQTRRTISFNRDLFELIHQAAEQEGKSASQWVTEAVRARLKRRGVALPAQYFDGRAPGIHRTNHTGAIGGGRAGAALATQAPVGNEVSHV